MVDYYNKEIDAYNKDRERKLRKVYNALADYFDQDR